MCSSSRYVALVPNGHLFEVISVFSLRIASTTNDNERTGCSHPKSVCIYLHRNQQNAVVKSSLIRNISAAIRPTDACYIPLERGESGLSDGASTVLITPIAATR